MPELLNKEGQVEGPTTRELLKQEISARQAANIGDNENDTTDTASEGESAADGTEYVVNPFEPGVQILGRRKIMHCHGSTSDFSAGFSLSVFTDAKTRAVEVSSRIYIILLTKEF